MTQNKNPVYSSRTVFEMCEHKLKIMNIENHPFGFVYRLSCRPHCCTHPNGIQMIIAENLLMEMVQTKVVKTGFMNIFFGASMGNIKEQLNIFR